MAGQVSLYIDKILKKTQNQQKHHLQHLPFASQPLNPPLSLQPLTHPSLKPSQHKIRLPLASIILNDVDQDDMLEE